MTYSIHISRIIHTTGRFFLLTSSYTSCLKLCIFYSVFIANAYHLSLQFMIYLHQLTPCEHSIRVFQNRDCPAFVCRSMHFKTSVGTWNLAELSEISIFFSNYTATFSTWQPINDAWVQLIIKRPEVYKIVLAKSSYFLIIFKINSMFDTAFMCRLRTLKVQSKEQWAAELKGQLALKFNTELVADQ